ncbi:acetoin utilization protein AcuC [Loktanella sp. SALINAS62]|uniref:acetoin utilization protein AcuC n=1 Tax=Loktanella sp. SALINAS62 TaxID=2706124 RepID=UPI001B8D7F39|nr:acetoin utilization protein AcuC [Loktanella sp. SALINAS62]MBS1300804.1 acetoin utilization protein AcuC [Loktanella sp. SALINAS62]
MQSPLFIGSEIYRTSSYGPFHPLRVPRVSTVMDLVRAMGWLAPGQYRTAPRAKPAALMSFHTPEYVTALEQAERDQAVSDAVRARHALGTSNNPIFPEMWRRPVTSAGAVMLAGELLRNGGIVYTPAGGTHHGFPDRAGGFCYLNDPVLAIQSLRRNGARRIAYVDIDAHHCDGVDHAFHADPDTLLISTHEDGRWPRTGHLDETGAGNVFNLPLPRGAHDDDMALVRDTVILPALAAFRPDAVVLQCGADAVEEDPQSRLSLSNNAHWVILQAIMPLAPRLMVLGGGGYNPWSVGRLWSGNWAILNGHPIPDELPGAAQNVLSALRWDGQRRVKVPPAHWITTLRDVPRPGPVHAQTRTGAAHLAARLIAWH